MERIIKGGLVVPATGMSPLPDGVVALRNGRITAVMTERELGTLPTDVDVIDAVGCTVLPGLIDVHVHVFMFPLEAGFSQADATVWATQYVRSALRAGVTTIRDLACAWDAIFSLQRGLNEGWVLGPRLLAAGQALTMTGGHGHNGGAVEVDGPIEAMKAARRQLKKGADVIKLMATGGVGTPGGELPTTIQLNEDEMAAAIREAHKAGKPATAHAHGTEGIKNALRAGVDCIEHGVFLDAEAIEMMLERNVALSPTLSVYRRIIEAGEKGLVPAFRVPKARAIMEAHAESFRQALAAGVPIVLGTDAVAKHHPLEDVTLEMEIWVELGMEPLAAIESATREAARVCQLGRDIGTLEAGKVADILIVEGNAISNITALRDVRQVFRAGEIVFQNGSSASHDARYHPLLRPEARSYQILLDEYRR